MGTRWNGLLAVAVICWIGACTDDDDRLRCPPKGIAVEPVDGIDVEPTGPRGDCSGGICIAMSGPETCADHPNVCWQVTNYERFACARPQICPDVGGADVQIFDYALGEDAAPVPVQVLLTNCSTGTNDLVIDRVEVFGDARCAFSEVTDADIGSKIVAPGETTVIRSTYHPGAPGEDHAELRVYSNAQNFPELRLLVCGVAWVSHGDAGPQDATAADAGCSEWTCVNGGKGCLPQTTKVPCHE